jgi:hypothetical protein
MAFLQSLQCLVNMREFRAVRTVCRTVFLGIEVHLPWALNRAMMA